MLCGLSRRLSKSFSRHGPRGESKREKRRERAERAERERMRRRSLDDVRVEIMAEFSSATIYDDDQGDVQVMRRVTMTSHFILRHL